MSNSDSDKDEIITPGVGDWILAVLPGFFGWLGAHNLYRGMYGRGIKWFMIGGCVITFFGIAMNAGSIQTWGTGVIPFLILNNIPIVQLLIVYPSLADTYGTGGAVGFMIGNNFVYGGLWLYTIWDLWPSRK